MSARKLRCTPTCTTKKRTPLTRVTGTAVQGSQEQQPVDAEWEAVTTALVTTAGDSA